jgi:hypothetical protein
MFTILILVHITVFNVKELNSGLRFEVVFTTRTADQRLMDFINNSYTKKQKDISYQINANVVL